MAAPVIAVAAKKAAMIILTDKRTWTVIGSVIDGIVAFIVIAVTVIFGGISAHNTAKEEGNAAMQTGLDTLFASSELPEDLPVEYRDGITKIKGMMTNIESEIEAQGITIDSMKAQMIMLCVLSDHVDNENFYADYISCFAGAENDGQIFDAITVKFGIEISEDDRVKILELYQDAQEKAAATSGGQAEISE